MFHFLCHNIKMFHLSLWLFFVITWLLLNSMLIRNPKKGRVNFDILDWICWSAGGHWCKRPWRRVFSVWEFCLPVLCVFPCVLGDSPGLLGWLLKPASGGTPSRVGAGPCDPFLTSRKWERWWDALSNVGYRRPSLLLCPCSPWLCSLTLPDDIVLSDLNQTHKVRGREMLPANSLQGASPANHNSSRFGNRAAHRPWSAWWLQPPQTPGPQNSELELGLSGLLTCWNQIWQALFQFAGFWSDLLHSYTQRILANC